MKFVAQSKWVDSESGEVRQVRIECDAESCSVEGDEKTLEQLREALAGVETEEDNAGA